MKSIHMAEEDMLAINEIIKKYGYPLWGLVMWDGASYTLLANTDKTEDVIEVLDYVVADFDGGEEIKWN